MPLVDGHYFPLNQMTPPGTYAHWANIAGRTKPEYFQPVKVSLTTGGSVTFYEGFSDRTHDMVAPAQASLLVGRMYRLKISNVPDLPGYDFYPTIELVDRLHPPVDKVEEFPVEVEFTLEELEWAANDRLVTKVVYLEQPNRVPSTLLESKERITTMEPSNNVIAEADLLGRPMAIIRMGGRNPDPHRPDPTFFGPGGPIRVVQKTAQNLSKSNRKPTNRNPSSEVGVINLRQAATRPVAQR